MNDAVILLEGATEPDRRSASAGGGEFVAYTCRSPDKITENEDTVAVIPYGEGAAVMLVADGAISAMSLVNRSLVIWLVAIAVLTAVGAAV